MISSLELARICGVSQGTVDRALHGRAGIAEKTRAKILEAARVHGYAPNPAARELMTGKSSCCGAVIPAGAGVFFMDLFEELRKALRKRGLFLLIAPAANADETADAIQELAARRVRGIAIVPPFDNFKVPDVIAGTPVASLASPCEGGVYIAPDETKTGENGAKALWSLGHRRIAFATYARDARAIRERREGYERFMRSKKLKPEILVRPSAEELSRAILENGVEAVFCHNDWMALKCLRALETSGIKVPEQVSLLGVDDSPTFNMLFPGISTMAYPYAAIAEATAALMAGETSEAAEIPPAELKLRESSTSRVR